MIEQLTPSFRFTCDRCGKEQRYTYNKKFPTYHVSFWSKLAQEQCGEVCPNCYKDFIELAESFFDELNKTEKGGTEE